MYFLYTGNNRNSEVEGTVEFSYDIVEIEKLEDEYLESADINDDGIIDVIDLSQVQELMN